MARLAEGNGETRQVRERMLTAAISRDDLPDPPTPDMLRLLIVRAQVRVLSDAPALVVLDYEAALEHAELLTDEQRGVALRGLTLAYLADRRLEDAFNQAATLLKPEGELVEGAAADPLVEGLIASARSAAAQGRKDDAAQVLSGIRTLLGQAISADLDAVLLEVQAEIEREDEPDEPEAE